MKRRGGVELRCRPVKLDLLRNIHPSSCKLHLVYHLDAACIADASKRRSKSSQRCSDSPEPTWRQPPGNGEQGEHCFHRSIITTHQYKIHDFWLPPELWWECLRWATLPSSGRLPLHDHPTCLDVWPLLVPYEVPGYEGPDVCYFYQQSTIYPTKRNLPLVCKLWATLSTEFLYECISLHTRWNVHTNLNRLLITLQHPNRGAELAKLVKRIEIDSDIAHSSHCEDLILTFLSVLPGLRVIRTWRNRVVLPLNITLKDQPTLGKLSALIVTPSTIASINTTSSNDDIYWKALTVIIGLFEMPDTLPILNRPMLHLKYFTIIFHGSSRNNILSSFSRLQGWPLPFLTHLSFHLCSNEHRGEIKDVVGAFGKQLEFLAVTGRGNMRSEDRSLFRKLLTAAPNVKEFVFGPKLSDNIEFDQLPPEKYASVEVVGLPVSICSGEGPYSQDFSWYIRLCAQAFPSLRIFRITGTIVLPNRETDSERYNTFWVRKAAIDLRSKGIRLEDRHGQDLWEELGTAAEEMEGAAF